MIGRLEQLKVDLLESPRVREFAGEVWASVKDTLDAALGDPDSELRQGFRSAVVEVGVAALDRRRARGEGRRVGDGCRGLRGAQLPPRDRRRHHRDRRALGPARDDREARTAGRARPAVHPHQRHGGRARSRGSRSTRSRRRSTPSSDRRSGGALRTGPRILGPLVGKRPRNEGRRCKTGGHARARRNPGDRIRPHRRRGPRQGLLREETRCLGARAARGVRHLGPPRLLAEHQLQRAPHPRDHAGDRRVPRIAGHHRARSSSAPTRTR